jgi:hypothetical protein
MKRDWKTGVKDITIFQPLHAFAASADFYEPTNSTA